MTTETERKDERPPCRECGRPTLRLRCRDCYQAAAYLAAFR